MGNLWEMLSELEQGKTLHCPVWHIYLAPTGNPDEVERTQYLMEGEWAKPRILTISELKARTLRHQAYLDQHHTEYVEKKEEAKKLDIVLPFGKHKGKRFSEVPKDYLEWMARQSWNDHFPEQAGNYLRMQETLDFMAMPSDDEDLDFDWEVLKGL